MIESSSSREPVDAVYESGSPLRLLHRVQRSMDNLLGSLPSRAVRLISRDLTDIIPIGSILVLAPHADDETLSSGAIIQRTLDNGGEVTVVVATDGRYGDPGRVPPEQMAAIRLEELARATAVLGVAPSSLIMLGFEDSTLSTNEERLAEALSGVIEVSQPEVIIAPCPWDLHPDHAALGRVTRRVLSGRPVRHYEYLIWGWAQPTRLAARLARRLRVSEERHWRLPALPVVVDGTGYLDKKTEALACYSSQFSATTGLHDLPIGGSGPLENEFLRALDYRTEVLFPRSRKSPGLRVRGSSGK